MGVEVGGENKLPLLLDSNKRKDSELLSHLWQERDSAISLFHEEGHEQAFYTYCKAKIETLESLLGWLDR